MYKGARTATLDQLIESFHQQTLQEFYNDVEAWFAAEYHIILFTENK